MDQCQVRVICICSCLRPFKDFVFYVVLRLAKLTKPIRPEPNNHAAAGTGMVETLPVIFH